MTKEEVIAALRQMYSTLLVLEGAYPNYIREYTMLFRAILEAEQAISAGFEESGLTLRE